MINICIDFWMYFGFTDYATNILITLERPFRGLVYSIVPLGISEL